MYDERLREHLIGIATEGKGAVLNGYDPAAESTAMGIAATRSTGKGGKKSSKKAATEKAETEETTDLPSGAIAGTGEAECPEGYPIKGNASSNIYHLPGQSSYDKTIPEICFASEDDATAAGYRASKSPGGATEESSDSE